MFSFRGKFKAPLRKKRPIRKQINWSKYQRTIFSDAASGTGHTIVLAVPGSGKSTTIVESLYHIPEEFRTNNRTLYVAFNASIAAHLDSQVPAGVRALTFHKLGFETVRNNLNCIGAHSVDSKGELGQQLAVEEVGNHDDTEKLRENLVMATDLAKTTLCESLNDIEELILEHGLDTGALNSMTFAGHVLSMMDKTRQPRKLNGRHCISFADMLWLPHVNDWFPSQYDRIFVDEAQDLSPARTSLIIKAMSDNCRLCATGDVNQAIFSFAGATSSIIDKLRKQLRAKALPLSVSYRCPKQIVELAKIINPRIMAANDAANGVIENINSANLYDKIVPGAAILSRTNYPLVTIALGLTRRGIKSNIMGKDLGNRLQWRVSSCWKPNDVPHLIRQTNAWKEEISAILKSKNRPTHRIEDEAECILRFAQDSNTITEVQSKISRFFRDVPEQVKLSSTHKAKGLEWNDVYLLEQTYHPDRNKEEQNLWYVAITRSKQRLVIVNGKI